MAEFPIPADLWAELRHEGLIPDDALAAATTRGCHKRYAEKIHLTSLGAMEYDRGRAGKWRGAGVAEQARLEIA